MATLQTELITSAIIIVCVSFLFLMLVVKVMTIIITDTVLDRIEKKKQRDKFRDGTELRVRY